jgi:LysM repeat protein
MPITPATISNVAPQQPVPTRADLKPPVEIVAIGPGSAPAAIQAQPSEQPVPMAPAADPRVMIGPAQANAQANAAPVQPAPAAQQPAPAIQPADASVAGGAANGGVMDPSAPLPQTATASNATPAVASAAPAGPTDQDLASVAASHGEPLVGSDGKPASASRSARSAPGSGGDYVAQSGDTLSHMASQFLGANTLTNRNAIIRLNPQLKANPDRIIVGQTYHIPAIAAQPTAAAPAMADAQPQDPAADPAAQTTDQAAPNQPNTQQSTAVATTGTETLYTVQPNDSLWKIASQQLGSPSAIDAIKELNKDVLKGENHDVLYAGMKIKLPARVAQAGNTATNGPVTAQ